MASGISGLYPMYTSGPVLVSGTFTLFEHGYQTISGEPDLYQYGHQTISGEPPLYSYGVDEASGTIILFEHGHLITFSGLNLFEHGHIVISGGYNDDAEDIRGFFMRIIGTENGVEEEVPNLVTDTWAANLQPKISSRRIAKILTATPTTSGIAITHTVNFFNKNCPFAGKILNVKAIAKNLTVADFNGTGGAINIIVQTSDEVDTSPNAPTTPSWDTLVSTVSCKDKATDSLCFNAPGDGTNVIDQTHHTIPAGGSLKATLTAQVENTYSGDGSPIEILVIVEYLPTDVKARHS